MTRRLLEFLFGRVIMGLIWVQGANGGRSKGPIIAPYDSSSSTYVRIWSV